MDPRGLDAALRSLPRGLDATYDRILGDIPPEQRSYVVRILQFALYSKKPMILEELVDIVAVHPDETLVFDEYDRMPEPLELAWCCASLVRVVSRDFDPFNLNDFWSGNSCLKSITELQLAHASVREYLLSNRPGNIFMLELQEIAAKASIVMVSLAYLHERSVKAQENSNDIRDMNLPFDTYAAKNWLDYASVAEKHGKAVIDWIVKTLTTENSFHSYLDLYDPDDDDGRSILEHPRPSPIYYASLGGLTASARILIANGAKTDINEKLGCLGTALMAAAVFGYIDLVRLLLDNGANINTTYRRGMVNGYVHDTALQAASRNGHVGIVKLLLGRGANANHIGANGSALQWAAYKGHLEVMEELIAGGADVNLVDCKTHMAGYNRGKTALESATAGGILLL